MSVAAGSQVSDTFLVTERTCFLVFPFLNRMCRICKGLHLFYRKTAPDLVLQEILFEILTVLHCIYGTAFKNVTLNQIERGVWIFFGDVRCEAWGVVVLNASICLSSAVQIH
jgi:hypothetical protein